MILEKVEYQFGKHVILTAEKKIYLLADSGLEDYPVAVVDLETNTLTDHWKDIRNIQVEEEVELDGKTQRILGFVSYIYGNKKKYLSFPRQRISCDSLRDTLREITDEKECIITKGNIKQEEEFIKQKEIKRFEVGVGDTIKTIDGKKYRFLKARGVKYEYAIMDMQRDLILGYITNKFPIEYFGLLLMPRYFDSLKGMREDIIAVEKLEVERKKHKDYFEELDNMMK